MARVGFDDCLGSKVRPVIVFDDRIILCVCMGVTSKQKDDRRGYKLKHWRYAGLKMQSWVRFEYQELMPDDFRDRVGMLHQDDIEGIDGWMRKIMYGHDL